jgi:chromosome segregation ATPase
MNFVGKILLFVQFVLSIFFMAFAGAVYTAHTNWREKALKTAEALQKKNAEFGDLQTQFDGLKRDLEAKVVAADDSRRTVEAAQKGLETELANLKLEAANVKVALNTAGAQAQIAGEDAAARKSEADNLRAINHQLTEKRDEEFAQRIKLEDANHSLEMKLQAATDKVRDLLGRNALLQQALASAGLPADVNVLAARSNPPPSVVGRITDVKPPKRQGMSELLQIELGSDDGLQIGHEMTAYRSSLNGTQQPRFLARVKIVDVTPDRSVGEVIESSRNGPIKRGDNVTTQF